MSAYLVQVNRTALFVYLSNLVSQSVVWMRCVVPAALGVVSASDFVRLQLRAQQKHAIGRRRVVWCFRCDLRTRHRTNDDNGFNGRVRARLICVVRMRARGACLWICPLCLTAVSTFLHMDFLPVDMFRSVSVHFCRPNPITHYACWVFT